MESHYYEVNCTVLLKEGNWFSSSLLWFGMRIWNLLEDGQIPFNPISSFKGQRQ